MNRAHLTPFVAVFALLSSACGTNRCITGESNACACVDGKMGAQTCQADGTYTACQCGLSLCNASNCNGCCDATGACQSGTTNAACGGSAQLCVACGSSQVCQQGVCTASGTGGGTGNTGGGTGGTGGGSASACGPSNCTGCCDSTGQCQYPTNTGSMLCGDSGALCSTCTANQLCVAGTNTCLTVKRIFATKTRYSGNLGGIAGADQKCTTAAQASLIGGTWKAWISDGTTDALSRIADVGPWYRLSPSKNKTKLFNNKVNLTTLPFAGVNVNEDGLYQSGGAWTGTVVGGTRSTSHCSNWSVATTGATGQVGDVTSTTGWTQTSFAPDCSGSNSIYCIEQ